MSWYETIDLDTLDKMREGSAWTSDPEHIQRCQVRTYEIAGWADTRRFIDGPYESDDEEKDDEAEDDEGGCDTPGSSSMQVSASPPKSA